jgi:hypothetical protein
MSRRHFAFFAALVFAAAPRAQETGSPEPQPDPEQVVHLRGVEVRLPDAMHPGEIQLVGLEQGTNSFRSATPALSMGNIAPKLIDPEVLYRSRMAMYGEPGFEAPPPDQTATRARRAPADPAAETPDTGLSVGTIVLSVTLLGAGVIALRRVRAARSA